MEINWKSYFISGAIFLQGGNFFIRHFVLFINTEHGEKDWGHIASVRFAMKYGGQGATWR